MDRGVVDGLEHQHMSMSGQLPKHGGNRQAMHDRDKFRNYFQPCYFLSGICLDSYDILNATCSPATTKVL